MKASLYLMIFAAWVCASGCAVTAHHEVPALSHGFRLPTGKAWGAAARSALLDPGTWIPLTGAILLPPKVDHQISDWAREERPLFGSTDGAMEWSDTLRTATHMTMVASSLAIEPPEPSGSDRKIRFFFDHAAATAATSTGSLKYLFDLTRTRPDGSDNYSLPSLHTTRAFAYAALNSRNLEETRWRPATVKRWNTASKTLAGLTGWARIEAGSHYPTDVLVGAALGNFMGLFLHDAFYGTARDWEISAEIGPTGTPVFGFLFSF